MWDNSIIYKLETAKYMIQDGINKLEKAPEKAAITDLMQVLKEVDLNYKYECDSIDEQTGIEYNGSPLYEVGMNSEFYIEGHTWHRISILLRALDDNKSK